MDKNIDEKIAITMKALEKNCIKPYYVENKEEALSLLDSLLNDGDTVTTGGSVTLDECGVINALRSGKYNFLDRFEEGLCREDIIKIFKAAFTADAYITSTNAITQDGALVNVDGNSNRVAAISYGPEKVYIIAGVNKIVENESAAFERIRNHTAPKNAQRLSCETPCAKTGKCENCNSPARICCTYVVQRKQRNVDRINVIIVNEKLGF